MQRENVLIKIKGDGDEEGSEKGRRWRTKRRAQDWERGCKTGQAHHQN